MNVSKKLPIAGILAGVLFLAACGSSEGSSGGSDASSGDGFKAAAVAESKANLEANSQTPKARQVETLPSKPPAGKKLTIVSCPVPQCIEPLGEAEKAAKAMGWTVNTIVSEFTPESYASSFDTALQQKPDYITFAVTMPLTVIKKQLEKAHEAGIAIFPGGLGPDFEVGGDNIMTGSVVGNKLNIAFSTLMADVVIAEAKATDKVVLVQDPAAPAHVNTRGTIEARLKAAGGKLDTFDVKLADTGTAMPGQIVSYLQSNPDVKYLLFADDTLTSGVPDAIKSAGLTLPKIIGQHPSGQQLKFIQDGDMYASIVADTLGSFWDVGDMMARLSIGAPIPDPEPIGQLLVVKKNNAATAPIGLFEGAPDNYLKAWLLQ